MAVDEISEYWEGEEKLLEAKEVYVVMQNDYRISRNIRAQWFFKNLNKVMKFKWKTSEEERSEEIEVISAIPKHQEKFDVDDANHSLIKLIPETKLNFLSSHYRLVFCLDLSSSVATVDIQHDCIYFEEIYAALEQSLIKVCEPFYVPGSSYYFVPQIHITVIAHIPNCPKTAPQVLIQGWILTSDNVKMLLEILNKSLHEVSKRVEKASLSIQDDHTRFMMHRDSSGSLVEETIEGCKMIKKVPDLSADISTLNLVRYGILALQLLPENSSAGIIVITDGVLSFPNSKALDSLLMQLRNSTIACSFLQLGSTYYPTSCFGRVPYKELMQFIATATCGAYFPASKDIVLNTKTNELNAYHKALLFWNFQRNITSGFLEAYEPSPNKTAYWSIENHHFYTVAHQSRVRKKHTEGTLKVSLENLLSCRLREGYTVKSVTVDESKSSTEVRLVLPWMLSTNIEYLITSGPGPLRQRKSNVPDIPSCHFEVIVDGCYEFLHDVTCSDKKPIKSGYRKTVIAQFWNYIKNLSNTDQILTQLHSFSHNPIYYTIPENIKIGVPLFYFPVNTLLPVLSSKNVANTQFTSFWKTLCMLDINVWQKWMHAHRIGIILQHDMPLPKDLHLPNSSGRYVHVQCRQSATALNSLLSELSSFVLVENHSYIKLLFDDSDKQPVSFYVIRVTSKPPCVVIRLAFLGGLPGQNRYKIMNDLKEKILSLKLTKRAKKDSTLHPSLSKKTYSKVQDAQCCFLLRKPVEKILIRYEKLPTNFLIPVPDSQCNARGIPASQKHPEYLYADTLITLSKYLQQERWIYTLQYEPNTSLDLKSASKILYTITNIRLQEGFHFTHSSFGVIYMVMEIPMEIPDAGSNLKLNNEQNKNCCVVQYILFPPHTNTTLKDSISEEDDTELTEADGELQLITECWLEPQYGKTVVSPKPKYLNGLTFAEISGAIHERDMEIFYAITTFEHLCSSCSKRMKASNELLSLYSEPKNGKNNPHVVETNFVTPRTTAVQNAARNVETGTFIIPYCFNLLSLLPKCHQTEALFLTLYQSVNAAANENEDVQKPNHILFEFLLANLQMFHDRELELPIEDGLNYLFQIHHRLRIESDPVVPFPHPESHVSCLSTLQQDSFMDFDHCKICSSFKISPDPQQAVNLDNIPRWKCFVKGCSASHFILTVIPSSYDDLRKLHMQYSSLDNLDQKNDESPKESGSNDVESNSEVQNDSEACEADQIPVPKENADDDATSYNCALTLPVYIYNCISSVVTNQLIHPEQDVRLKDSFEKHAFKYESISEDRESSNSEHHLLVSEVDVEANMKRKKEPDILMLEDHCCLLDKAFSKAFVYGVYRSLTSGLDVRRRDAIAAIDEVCEESLLEIDITDFVYMICGHVKDFTAKHSVRQMQLETSVQECGQKDENVTIEKVSEKHCFPLSLLQKHQPCEHLQQKHLNIKNIFFEILKNFFKPIPSRPDYYFYIMEEDTEDALSIDASCSQSEGASNIPDTIINAEDGLENETDRASNMVEEEMSPKSGLHTESSLSSIEKDSDPISVEDRELLPPLFVHFTCSVRRSKQEIISCPLISLPTCLNDVIKCIDPNCSEVDLGDLRITLDITCLTVPNDIENPVISKHHQYCTSFSSSSPIPETECYRKQEAMDEDNESICSDIPTDTVQGGTLQNLPSFQQEAVYKCIDKIKWLLQDEKASSALNSFPITDEILKMVTDHVKTSKDKPCCIIKEIPLMFVYGPENSLDKFTQAFKRMSPVGYRLNEVDKTYYLVLDAESAKKVSCPFGSLDPPLGIAEKYLIVKRNPHCDDRTELKRIGDEVKDTSVFDDKEFSFFSKSYDADALNDDSKTKADTDALFGILRGKRFRQLQGEDDTETEDSNDVARHKAKFCRKSSVKKVSTGSRVNKRTVSNPSISVVEGVSSVGRPHTAPPNFSQQEKLHRRSGDLEQVLDFEPSIETEWNTPFDNAMESGSEMQATSPPCESSPDLTMESKEVPLTSTVAASGRFRPPESAGSPVVYSEVDFGSCHYSNTEDGYDGDSSDTGSDLDWLSTLDTRRPVLPKFWLIMNICETKVVVYFHMRHRDEENEELIQSKGVLNEVVSIVTNICKEVNQILLLYSLYETRMCDRLLVPEGNDDMWKKKDSDFGSHTSSRKISDADPLLEVQEKYLEATLKFEPGAFDCPVVWITHFKLHHRLAPVPPGQTKSWGMQALRSVLNTFSVNNRENMFVYQEDSGSVFYLRLFEESCEENHSYGQFKMEDSMSLLGSCWSSLQSLPQKRTMTESDVDSFRPRVNSGSSDITRQDSVSSTLSSSYKKQQKCVALYVHGIGQVGTAITNDLVQLLQNRLNEGVLDIIIMLLCRNPSCKLTPEDVQFIQNPSSPPTHELHFTLPVKLLGYAHSIHVYLRQNLLHFLYNPKYTDSKRENHFKAYSHNPVEWTQVDDNDIFLFHSQQASGYSGSKGICCIVLSLVTGQGDPFQNLNNLLPNPSTCQDDLSESDFEDLVSTSIYTVKNDRTPGPVALIRFQIWSIGKSMKDNIESRLENAVRHALWDLLMEYRTLTTPISDSMQQDDSSCYSEPTTPIRTRRSGRATIDQSFHLKDFSSSVGFPPSKEMSSSVPDITAKAHSPQPLLKEISLFKFNNGPHSAKPEFSTETTSPLSNISPRSNPDHERKTLNHMFHTVMKSFLHFGDRLACPALLKQTFTLPSRHSVVIVLKEVQNIIKAVLRDVQLKTYLRMSDVLSADTEFIPFNPQVHSASSEETDEIKPGTTASYILIGRNERQWKAYMGMGDFSKFHESYYESLKTYQKCQTHICNPATSETFVDSLPSSPAPVSRSNSITALTSPRMKSPGIQDSQNLSAPSSSVMHAFVPRQRFLVMYVQDKEMTLFLYNWSQDITGNLLKLLNKLVQWHHHRNCLLNNILLQKLGVFHGQSCPYQGTVEKTSKEDKNVTKDAENPVMWTPTFVEQLIHHHSPPRELPTTSSTSKSATISHKTSLILKTLKNTRPLISFHQTHTAIKKDPVVAHGEQFQKTISAQRRDMHEMHNMWQTRGSSVNNPTLERNLHKLKRVARLSHFCFTPILFSPSWRWKVAPIRDHTVEPLEMSIIEKSSDTTISRSRHSSGSSLKNSDGSGNSNNSMRARRVSGSAHSNSNQSSPKLRTKTPSEETWHSTVCRHYLQEYVQYLHTIGFVSLQRSEIHSNHSGRQSTRNDDDKNRTESFSYRSGMWGPPVFYLIKSLLGGLLVFEIGLSDPYAYAHLYSIECSRFTACAPRTLSSQFTAAFLDELDKIKLIMHLHSFTYDYHLRTIHSYISGRQLIFRHGYHLTSFLDDFIKYYQKAPNGARNLLYAGSLAIPNINMSGGQLYNYIISHNQLYGMTVLRMVPVVMDGSSNIDTEFALVELSAQKASYKDVNDICQRGSFDVGLLINHNILDTNVDPCSLVLNYYIILTSQRDLYPKLSNFGATLGSFQTVRFGSTQTTSGQSSRKTSTVSMVTDKEKFESSGEESGVSSDSKSNKLNTVRAMCDEEVTYLGYFSSQETMMQQVLIQQADAAKTHLQGVVLRASIHCRRDSLWSCLLLKNSREEASSKDHSSSAYSDFAELLNLVTMIPLSDIDEKLTPFMNLHISWYQTLAPVLKLKYLDTHREFLSADGNAMYVVVTSHRCPDSFLLLAIDLRTNKSKTDLCLVFREPPTDLEHTIEKPNQRVLALQSMVEGFVNACSFHLWTSIL